MNDFGKAFTGRNNIKMGENKSTQNGDIKERWMNI